MNKISITEFKLIGIALKTKTTNQNGQSDIDCGNLWQKFENEKCAAKIPGKLSNEIFAVYHTYEGDHTKPFSYFIGCKVKNDTFIPLGFDSLTIIGGSYENIVAEGKVPDCVANSWKKVWKSNPQRAYNTDFEVYGEKSKDWNNAEVDIFISIK